MKAKKTHSQKLKPKQRPQSNVKWWYGQLLISRNLSCHKIKRRRTSKKKREYVAEKPRRTKLVSELVNNGIWTLNNHKSTTITTKATTEITTSLKDRHEQSDVKTLLFLIHIYLYVYRIYDECNDDELKCIVTTSYVRIHFGWIECKLYHNEKISRQNDKLTKKF